MTADEVVRKICDCIENAEPPVPTLAEEVTDALARAGRLDKWRVFKSANRTDERVIEIRALLNDIEVDEAEVFPTDPATLEVDAAKK